MERDADVQHIGSVWIWMQFYSFYTIVQIAPYLVHIICESNNKAMGELSPAAFW